MQDRQAWQRRPGGLCRAGVALALAAALTCPASAGGPAPPADHAEQLARGQELFTRAVRPVLLDRCLRCHGGPRVKGGLDLGNREALLRGGSSGPAVVPGKSRASRLYRLISYLDDPHMPAQGARLGDEQVADIAAWIDLGAPYDRPLVERAAPTAAKPKTVSDEDRQFWSFRPVSHPAVPVVHQDAWCRTPVDRFILARLEEKGLLPNPPADRRTLIRRASFDLLGLPPTPAEVDAFVNDPAADAYEQLIDRLLASPHYGERWARHWLDLARFAESHGFEHDYDRPSAYHYRDFVVKALNQDLPYDTFVKWQIAGDEYEPTNPLALMATGFLAAGPHSTQITKNQVEKERYDELDDMTRTLGTAMLGLTVGCARCHDHKFDPIPTRDYYRLLATFTTTVRSEAELQLGPGATVAAPDKSDKAPRPGTTKVLICSEGVPAVRLHTQGGDFLEQTHFLKRGDPNQKEGVATPGFLQVLTRTPEGEKRWQTAPPPGWHTSYRRRALAEWLADADQGAGALLARVIVNRLWQHHLGRGIVGTPSDFGTQGDRPTHPELLDRLAGELVRNDWRLKAIHKLIMTSAVYVQDDACDPRRTAVDPEDRLWWRREPRRLEAEVVRDNLLAVSGTLDERLFGPGSLDPGQKRRSLYFFVKRSQLIPTMVLFDAPDALQGLEQRATTTIAPQALLLMNSPIVRGYAEEFGRRLSPGKDTPLPDAVCAGYRIALGREPTRAELDESVEFIGQQLASYQADRKANARQLALADFCQVLMGLNEFVYVD